MPVSGAAHAAPARILVVEDPADTVHSIVPALGDTAQFEVTALSAEDLGLWHLAGRQVDCIVLDCRLPSAEGIRLLTQIRRLNRDLPIIVVGAPNSAEIAVEAMKRGATDYIAKHNGYLSTLPSVIHETLGFRQLAGLRGERARHADILANHGSRLDPDFRERCRRIGIVGESESIERTLVLAQRALNSRVTVLLEGETGTGKELFARVLHQLGSRAGRPFIAFNCATVTESLFESELFGHVRGAFTGADRDHKGLFEMATGGTLLLDEIGEATLAAQAKLLRVLQCGEIRPVGSTQTKRVDVRLIAATNRDLEREARCGRFRLDLYYRLAAFPIRLPALRDRPEDVELLARYFLQTLAREERPDIAHAEFEPDALSRLRSYSWPGNVRELENEMQRLILCADPGELIGAALLSPHITSEGSAPPMPAQSLKEILRNVEAAAILSRLRAHAYNRSSTARSLGVGRETLWAKMRDLEISTPPRGFAQ